MCVEVVANVNVYAEGYIGQTVSVVLHEVGCADPTEVTTSEGMVPTESAPPEHTHDMDM